MNYFSKGFSLYFIGEIGINHNGDIEVAKRLIDACVACGWDCAKFQKRNPDKCIPEHQKNVIKNTPWGDMTYLQYKKKVEFERKEYEKIQDYCYDSLSQQRRIDWSASVWDIDSLNFLLEFEPDFIKIPSALITDRELILEASKSDVQLVISTGMSTLKQMDDCINLIMGTSRYIPAILHCNSSYPTPVEDCNIRMIPFLIERYSDSVIGYSGHEFGLEPTVVAVALGAQIIERHITINKEMWGTDQKSSLEVHAMDMLRKRCLEAQKSLGTGIKKITEKEKEIKRKLRGK